MNRNVVWILVGLGIGFLIFQKKGSVKESDGSTQEKPTQVVQSQSKRNKPLPTRPFVENEHSSTLEPLRPHSEEIKPVETTHTHLLNLNISEEQIEEMEENIDELQKDVSLFRDDKGWVVHFYTQNNVLSRIGIKDNDLIRYEYLEKLKKDHRQTYLISRLEDVIKSLQQ